MGRLGDFLRWVQRRERRGAPGAFIAPLCAIPLSAHSAICSVCLHRYHTEPVYASLLCVPPMGDACMYVCMHACMRACMYVCMDGWLDGWMDGCMDVWMCGCMDVYPWMYGCMDVCRRKRVCMHASCLRAAPLQVPLCTRGTHARSQPPTCMACVPRLHGTHVRAQACAHVRMAGARVRVLT